jgi:hypothetical protein
MSLFFQSCGPTILRWGALAIALSACANAPGAAAEGEEPMRVTLQTEGGVAHFPGLSKPVTIETNQLSEQDAAELKRLVDAARLSDRPAQLGRAAPGAADYQQYTITVETGDRSQTVRMSDLGDDPDLKRLLRFLQDQAKALRAKARAGGTPDSTP